jgi:hypothetical protein
VASTVSTAPKLSVDERTVTTIDGSRLWPCRLKRSHHDHMCQSSKKLVPLAEPSSR